MSAAAVKARRSPSRRAVMYALVGAQLAVLGAIVAAQEVNRALDRGPGIDLELVRAHAQKDPFRGAYVTGDSSIDLHSTTAALPTPRLRAGEKVLVFFSVGSGQRPRIVRVERRGRGAGPMFGATEFSIPGKVRGDSDRWSGDDRRALTAKIGDPAVVVALDMPATIPVDDTALAQLTGASLIRARLHRGYLGHRYLADVRFVGRSWPYDAAFVYDAARARLIVSAPRRDQFRRAAEGMAALRTDLFFLDAAGNQQQSAEIPGRVIESAVSDADGSLVALVSEQSWGETTVLLTRVKGGEVTHRSAPLATERVVGFDAASGTAWVVGGVAPTPPRPPYFAERIAPEGTRGPRLGPFASAPRRIVSAGEAAWVLEPTQHRITHVDVSSGRTLHEYRDLNGPLEIAVDGESLFVIEASHTQLTKLDKDGRVAWRAPRFQGLAWVLPDPGTGGGWIGASRFEDQGAGVFRFAADGAISRVPAAVIPMPPGPATRGRFASVASRDGAHGRLYVREAQSIVILDTAGTLLKRVDGFRLPTEQRIRS